MYIKAIVVLFNKKHSCVIQQSLVVVGFYFYFFLSAGDLAMEVEETWRR